MNKTTKEIFERMKRYLLPMLIALLLMFGACSNSKVADETPKETSVVTPINEQSNTPVVTSTLDFSDTDFSGKWHVDSLMDSNGHTVSEGEKRSLGGDFTLELLGDGAYFVYDETDTILGQGTYSVKQNRLTLTAADEETCYEIQDNDTLFCTISDGSITIMKRADLKDSDQEAAF